MASKFREANKFILDDFLDTFGREFCKHEVLWKPKPNCKEFGIQSATHVAYSTLAQALHMSVETVLELLKTFPEACRDLINRYELRRKIDASCCMPDWLTLLAGQFRFLKNSTKSMKAAVCARGDLVLALCESARMGLGGGCAGGTDHGTGDDAPPLWGPRAVAYFVARHDVREEEVLPAWRSALELCIVKLRAVLATGDRLARLRPALRPTTAESALADLALLHDHRMSQITFLTPAKLRTLVLLFQLIVAAKESYNGGGSDGGGGDPGDDNISSRLHSNVAPETANSSSIRDATTAPSTLDCAMEQLSVECVEARSAGSPYRARVVGRAARRPHHHRHRDHAPVEDSSDEELHKELNREPHTHVISSDTSDCEIFEKYFEACSKVNTEVPVLLDEGRINENGSDIMEKNNLGDGGRESYNSARSQYSDTRSEYPTKYWYEESASNSSEERKAVWALVYTEFIKRGRSASLISLQHRWVELLHVARVALLSAWSSDALVDRNVHPLLLVVAHWFPEIVTENLPSWKSLVFEGQIVLESDIKDIINKYKENGNLLLNITENLTFPDLLQKYVRNKNAMVPQSNATNKHLSYQIHKETPSCTINNTDKDLEQETHNQDNAIDNELNVNNCISRMLDEIDPSKAKISIIIDEDSDEDAGDGNSTNYDSSLSHETTPHLNNLNVSKSEGRPTYLREENNHTLLALEERKNLTEITMKNIEKELEDKLYYINNTLKPRRNLFVGINRPELNENINDNNVLRTDQQTVSHDFGSQEESSLLPSYKPVFDEKLVNPALIVITPIEHLPEWKKHSRNGVIKCRKFSVKNFTKPVTANSIQLSRCASNVNKNHSENYKNNEVRIKFEDDTFETDFGFGDDINNGIKYQKYIELYNMPDHLRKNRIKLTRTLKLSRTYFSLKFWSLDSNIRLMKLCKPMTIKLCKGIPRVAKRVELSDINEIRRINRSILTAQVSPTVGTPPPRAQRSSTSQEAANSTSNSIYSNSVITRQTNNSLSSALDSTELLKLLTNFVIQTNIPRKSVSEPVTKDITSNSNLMDSIIDTMRLADKKDTQNSTVISEMLVEPCNTIISATHRFTTIQKSTEEVRNNLKLKSINNSLLDATTSKIDISNCTRELYTKHVQINNMNNTSLNLEETVKPYVGDLKDMILLLVKRFDTKMRHEYGMKLNRSSLNLHLKNFEKQLRGLFKNISKLTKILPEYVLNMKLKRRVTINATAQNKRTKLDRIKWKQSKENSTLPSSNTENSIDTTNNTNSVFVDDDCEPILVIDESSLELSDNFYLNNSQCTKINTNKNIIQETCNIKKIDIKGKHIKRVKKKSRQSKKIVEKEKPMLNEYQEWHRQKTMALKYFTIPMSDTSKQISKDKIAQQQSSMITTEQQSNGCQTTIPIKRKNTEDLATTSATSEITKRPKSLPKESNVVYISDSSSDDDEQITNCYIAPDINDNNSNTIQAGIHQSDKTEKGNQFLFLNGSLQKQRNQNACVTNGPVAESTRPVYLIIDDTRLPTATQDSETINNPVVFQVLSNGTPFPTLTQTVPQNETRQTQILVMNEKCTFTNKCKCINCENTLRDDILTCSLDLVQSVTSGDSRNNEPSTSLPKEKDHLLKEAITVKEYLSGNKKLTALIKVDGSQKLLFFCSKYIILTDVNIPSSKATYRTSIKINNKKKLGRVLVPSDSKGSVLLLGLKNESDYMYCKCLKGKKLKCNLCQRIKDNLPNHTNLLKIDSNYYKSICQKPNKYVRLNKNELLINSRAVLQGNPDLILVNKMFFKKLTDTPPTYVRILSAPQDAATLRQLVRKEVLLYAFDITLPQNCFTPLVYTQTAGHITVEHSDKKLVKVLQRILN